MTDAQVIFCPGPGLDSTWCGRYTTAELAAKPSGKKQKPWHPLPARHPYDFAIRLICDDCFRASIKARVRALIVNGALKDGLDISGLSDHERQAAAEMLGPDWMATVDRGWDEDRKTTPPMGTPMGRAA